MPTRMAIIKNKHTNKQKQKITSIGKNMEKLEPPYIAGRNALENNLWFLKKLNRRTI